MKKSDDDVEEVEREKQRPKVSSVTVQQHEISLTPQQTQCFFENLQNLPQTFLSSAMSPPRCVLADVPLFKFNKM